jgi:eukaryotic-like serine/threonine-protein kinase
LLAQEFDPARLQLKGEPVAVAEDVANNESIGRASFAVSGNGVLVYRTGGFIGTRQLTWYDRQGKRLGTAGDPGRYTGIALSPDEKRVALSRNENGNASQTNIWVLELGNGVLTRLTFDLELHGYPRWSPDSRRIAFSNFTKGGIFEVAVASAAKSPLVADSTAYEGDWSPDGRYFAYSDSTYQKLSLLSLSGERKSQMVLNTPFAKHAFHFSPDGQWMAYQSRQSGRYEVYVASLPSFTETRQISSGGGAFPLWRQGSNELYFIGSDQRLWVAEIKGGSKMEPVVPKPLFPIQVSGSGDQYAVTADGKRFLVNESLGGGEGQVNIVLNWTAEMKR